MHIRSRSLAHISLTALVLALTSSALLAQPAGGPPGGPGGGFGAPPEAVDLGPASISPPPVTPAADPTDPFAAVVAGTMTPDEYRAQYRYNAALDPDDPFNNWAGGLWGRVSGGQWQTAYENGMTFAEFWETLQGTAGASNILESPYPYSSAEEHWNAWSAAANDGAGPAYEPATPQEWEGQWGGGDKGNVLVRDFYNFASEEYQARYLRSVQSEVEGRAYWPNAICLPNAYSGVGTFQFQFADLNGPLVHLNNMYAPAAMYEGRYIWVGAEFTDMAQTFMGESIAFWDGDELVVWTRNVFPNSRGHVELEYSDQLQLIERYYQSGENILVDTTRYDPLAYSGPMHSTAVYTRNAEYTPITVEECSYGNNFYYDENGLNAFLVPGDPRYSDRFTLTPWDDIFAAGEAAQAAGIIPPTTSILDSGSSE